MLVPSPIACLNFLRDLWLYDGLFPGTVGWQPHAEAGAIGAKIAEEMGFLGLSFTASLQNATRTAPWTMGGFLVGQIFRPESSKYHLVMTNSSPWKIPYK